MPERPTPITKTSLDQKPAETATSLVNENDRKQPETETPEEQIKRLTVENESYKRGQERYKQRAEIAEAKVARNHSSPEAMRFRIFLELVNGFAAANKFDPQTSAGKEARYCSHAAGIAELAYAELEKKGTFGT